MASDTGTPPAVSPLGCMAKLSTSVYIYRPEAPAPAAPSATDAASPQRTVPKLIILATWMGARDPHIAKYLVQYQALYPTAPILLLRSEPRHFLLPGGNPREFAPAVPFVRAIFPDIGRDNTNNNNNNNNSNNKNNKPTNPEPELLLHAWSNGGAASLLHLRTALSLSSPSPPPAGPSADGPATLPRYTLVLDSSPGRFRYGAGYRAFGAGLPPRGPVRWLAAPLLHALCAVYWLRHALIGRGRTGPMAALARALNDGGARRAEVRRTYVYGPEDRLVDWRDVEEHAEEAVRGGFAEVRREKFEGGEHVAHVRVDAGRYWRVVRETWAGVE